MTPHERSRETIRRLSDRIVEAQRPIRILDAIKWGPQIQHTFLARRARELPEVNADYYRARPLGFDPDAKYREFLELERDIQRELGGDHPLGYIMLRMSQEYRLVVTMLEKRGSPEFGQYACELYGSVDEPFHRNGPTIADLGALLADATANISTSDALAPEPKTIPAANAVALLQERFDLAFGTTVGRAVRVKLSDGIVADAAAGADYLKVRQDALFNARDLRLLEVHEGWVHLGTTLNGMAQPVCTFLSKGPPSSTITQEGLAVLTEIIAFASYPSRLLHLANRVRAIQMAEHGADFLEVFRFFRSQGADDAESYAHAVRVFRGSTPQGPPFTKDLSYNKGFILIYNFLRLAVRKGTLRAIPLLFCGKTTLADLRALGEAADAGLIAHPYFLPPQFADLNAVSAWMCYSNFLNRLNLEQMAAELAEIL